MRIPLDYFSVLGIPFQVSEDQISLAYQDRLIQLPRREFSEAAIAARNLLLEEAHAVLANEEQRDQYQQRWWSSPSPEPEIADSVPSVSTEDHEAGQPNLEVSPQNLIGALLILQDLGEYELVLTFAEAEIYHPEQPTAIAATRSDLILISALAYLEISREQWQRSDYEGAANAGLKGLARLQQEDLFANVQEEIRDELYKLRPYRILEFLTPERAAHQVPDVSDRVKAIELLKDMIQDRFGIEGRGNDRSGLGIDDFLQFIQQLRPYLTVDEQESLFLAEADRPSVIASFLAVYALLAKAIAAKQPEKLSQCKMLLTKLKNRQEVALEEAICALLLGQTEAALLSLNHCRDEKAIAFIKANSQGESDLIPGLYAYAEQWLKNEIFPCFLDLSATQQSISLADYFADVNVQHRLNQLDCNSSPPHNAVSPIDRENTMALKLSEYSEPLTTTSRPSRRRKRLEDRSAIANSSSQSTLLADLSFEEEPRPMVWSSVTEPFNTEAFDSGEAGQFPAPADYYQTTKPIDRKSVLPKRRKRRRVKINPVRFGLFLLTCFGLFGVVLLLLFGNRSPLNALEAEQLDISLAQAAIEIPDPHAVIEATAPTGELTKASAQQLVQYWLSRKAVAYGPNHDIEALSSVLVAPMLNQWQNRANQEEANKSYRQYQHQVEILDVKMDGSSGDRGQILARVKEQTLYFKDSNPEKPYKTGNDNITVRYQVIRQGDQWRIQQSAVE